MPNEPAGTNDFVYPGMIEVRENDSIDTAMNAARGEITNPIARDILPDLDFDAGAADDAPDTVPESFLQLTGGTDDTDAGTSEVYEIDSDTGKAERRVIAIYGFEAVENADLVDRIRFLGSDGQVFERAHVEGLDTEGDNPVDRQKTLNSPILFDVQDNGSVEFVHKDITEDEEVRIKLLGVTVEKQGRRVGSRS